MLTTSSLLLTNMLHGHTHQLPESQTKCTIRISFDPGVLDCVHALSVVSLLMHYVTHSCPLPQLSAALRRCAVAGRGVPVLCGSALRNRGIQPLMDAITAYLPAPNQRAFNKV